MQDNKSNPNSISSFAIERRKAALAHVGEYLHKSIDSESLMKQILVACNIIFTLGHKAHKDELSHAGVPEDVSIRHPKVVSELETKRRQVIELEAILARLVENGNQDAVREFIHYKTKK